MRSYTLSLCVYMIVEKSDVRPKADFSELFPERGCRLCRRSARYLRGSSTVEWSYIFRIIFSDRRGEFSHLVRELDVASISHNIMRAYWVILYSYFLHVICVVSISNRSIIAMNPGVTRSASNVTSQNTLFRPSRIYFSITLNQQHPKKPRCHEPYT